MQYRIDFVGRKVGAVGIRYSITETVEAESKEGARLALYEQYEHITVKSTERIEPCKQSL